MTWSLKQLKRLIQVSTKRPWTVTHAPESKGYSVTIRASEDERITRNTIAKMETYCGGKAKEAIALDAEYLATACNALPDMVDLVEKMAEALELTLLCNEQGGAHLVQEASRKSLAAIQRVRAMQEVEPPVVPHTAVKRITCCDAYFYNGTHSSECEENR